MTRVLCALLAAGLEMTVLPAGASSWTALTVVSPDYGGTNTGLPDSTVSPLTGDVYLACDNNWNPANGNDRLVNFCRGVRNGRSFDWSHTRNTPVEVCPRGTKAGSPSIAVSRLNGREQIHIVYWDHLGTENLMYVRSVDGGSTWSAPFAVTGSGTPSSTTCMAGDEQGNVYLFYSDWTGNANANNLDIWFRRGTFNGTTTTWGAARKIESNAASKSERPRCFRDQAGRIHVAWADRLLTPPRAAYAVTTNNGETFSAPETAFSAESGDDFKPVGVAADSGGTVYIAGHSVLYYQCCEPSRIDLVTKPPGGAWAPKTPLVGNPSTNPFLTADHAGNVFLTWLRLPNSGGGDIYFMAHNALGWSCPFNTTRDDMWRGYDGGQHTVDPYNGFVHVATDDTISGYHRAYVTTLDLQATPLPVVDASARRGNGQAAVNWRNLDEPDIAAVRCVYRPDRYPESPADGAFVERMSPCGQPDSMVVTGLTNFTTYYFALYTRSAWSTFSTPARATALVAPRIPGDMDDDFDVDQADFGLFQVCFSGEYVAQAEPACAAALLDADNDVDGSDAALLIDCLTGPNERQRKPECLLP